MYRKNTTSDRIDGDYILELASGYQKSRIILTAFELDIFTIIGTGSMRSSEVAGSMCAPNKSIDRLLNALCALGLLKKDKGLFSNTAASARYLVKGSEDYLTRIGHMINLYRSWGTLTDAVRAGRSVSEREYDETSLVRFIAAMHHRAGKTAMGLVSHIDLTGVARVLDVGGGSGVYSMAFVRSKPGLVAVVFDLPQVIALTETYIAESGLSGRITTMNGDYNAGEFGTGYDLVFMSAIIHINSYDENQSLINKAYASLNPGGRIIIQDHIMDEDRTTPVRGALFSLNMLVNTENGDTYTEQEMRAWLKSAGCSDIQRVSTGMDNDLMVGRRPV